MASDVGPELDDSLRCQMPDEYRRLLCSALLVAWQDAVGNLESTSMTRRNRTGLMDLAQKWIKGKIEDDWIESGTYRHWMQLVGLDPDLDPEKMISEHGANVLTWWNK